MNTFQSPRQQAILQVIGPIMQSLIVTSPLSIHKTNDLNEADKLASLAVYIAACVVDKITQM